MPAGFICPDFSATLTTTAFDRSSSRWLGISDLIAEPEGPTFISSTVTQRRLDRRYSFAVETVVTDRPPHRSARADFPHAAPTLGVRRQSAAVAMGEGFSAVGESRKQSSRSAPTSCDPCGYVAAACAATGA